MAKCPFCHKDIKEKEAYIVKGLKRNSYYCNEEHYNKHQNKIQYEPKGGARLEYTDYIQKIYLENKYNNYEIPWTMLMAQTKNMMQEHKEWTYQMMKYVLYYMYEILELNLFTEESKGSILTLLPFYFNEARQYCKQVNFIKQLVKDFEDGDEIIITKHKKEFEKEYIVEWDRL